MSNNVFLKVSKDYFGLGLKANEIMIISSIEEYTGKGLECCLTNEQFAYIIGESTRNVSRVLDKLEDSNIIIRNTITLNNNGQQSKKRTIKLKDINVWYVESNGQNDTTFYGKVGTICQEGKDILSKRKGQNGTIKDKEKDNKKDKTTVANAPDAYVKRKWIPKNDSSKELFEGSAMSDSYIMQVVNELKEDNYTADMIIDALKECVSSDGAKRLEEYIFNMLNY